jgi:hypothetical protein
MMDRRHRLASVAAVSAWIVLAGVMAAPAHDRDDDDADGTFTFALWGDTPYAAAEIPKVPALIADINAARVSFSVFDGDIKSGSSQCTDDQFDAALQRFDTLRSPLVYVPGDNEWTDCHRINNGGYNALERLAFLRQTMFADERSFGQRTMRLQHQGPPGGLYAENTRWTHGGVVFLGLNIPGSNNNKVTTDCISSKSVRTQADCDADNAEYQARDAANIQWLHDGFALAKSRHMHGLMLVLQADVGFDLPETEETNEHRLSKFAGYTAFLTALVAEAQAFDGEVVFVHGDQHFFKVDKPLNQEFNDPDPIVPANGHLIRNITRVETFGSPNVHWVKVTVDPRSRSLFRFEPMIVSGN